MVKKKNEINYFTSTLAKSQDGGVQATYTVSVTKIKSIREAVVKKLVSDVDVPGFRKGKAPLDITEPKIPPESIIRETVSVMAPDLIKDLLENHKVKPALYPKIELINADTDKEWQIRLVTCEIPEFEIGDYKKMISGGIKSSTIWTPDKGTPDNKEKPEMSQPEKEQEVLKLLVDNIKINIPKMLIQEEVNSRLSNLLSRLEKLGLDLESYLASINKNPEILRTEYEKQAHDAILIDLILAKVASLENIKIEDKQIDEMLTAAKKDSSTSVDLDTPSQRQYIRSILAKREALSSLVQLFI